MAQAMDATTTSSRPLFGASEYRPGPGPSLWSHPYGGHQISAQTNGGYIDSTSSTLGGSAPAGYYVSGTPTDYYASLAPIPFASPTTEDIYMQQQHQQQQQQQSYMQHNYMSQQHMMLPTDARSAHLMTDGGKPIPFGGGYSGDVSMSSQQQQQQQWPQMYDASHEMVQAEQKMNSLKLMPQSDVYDMNQQLQLNKQQSEAAAMYGQQQSQQPPQQAQHQPIIPPLQLQFAHQYTPQPTPQQISPRGMIVETDMDTNMLSRSNYASHDTFPDPSHCDPAHPSMPSNTGSSFDFIQEPPAQTQQPVYVGSSPHMQNDASFAAQSAAALHSVQDTATASATYPALHSSTGSSNAGLSSPTVGMPVATQLHFGMGLQGLPTQYTNTPLASVYGTDSLLSATSEDGKQVRRRGKKRKKPPTTCLECGVGETPEWRRGPQGPRTLCNACGLRYAKRKKRKQQQVDKETLVDRLPHPLSTGSVVPVMDLPTRITEPAPSPSSSPSPSPTPTDVYTQPTNILAMSNSFSASLPPLPLSLSAPALNTVLENSDSIGASPSLAALIHNNRTNSEALASTYHALKKTTGIALPSPPTSEPRSLDPMMAAVLSMSPAPVLVPSSASQPSSEATTQQPSTPPRSIMESTQPTTPPHELLKTASTEATLGSPASDPGPTFSNVINEPHQEPHANSHLLQPPASAPLPTMVAGRESPPTQPVVVPFTAMQESW